MLGNRFLQSVVISLGALLVVACGGGTASFLGSGSSSGGSSSGGSGSSSGTTSGAASIVLLASSPQLLSAASTSDKGVTITAVVKDTNNNLLSGTSVIFATTSGAIQPGGTTDVNGTISTVLTTGGDPTNRTITVTATAGTVTSTVDVQETGSALSVSGSNVVGSGGTTVLTVTLADSSGSGIPNKTVTMSSSLNNSISPTTATTNSSGQATFTYTGTTGGTDTVTASALGLTATQTISVAATNLVFQTPSANASISFGQVQAVSVLYTNNGAPVSGATVNFSTTRGTLNGAASTTASAVTNASGVAQVTIQSNGASGAGGVVISAQVASGGPSATLSIQLVATTPATISVQASPSTVAVSSTSSIKVLVRDASNNLVAGQTVQFALSDTTGGSLSVSTATTDQNGSATISYTAGTTTSATNGVTITASVAGTAISSSAQITVGGQALFIRLGSTNLVDNYDPTGGSNFTEYQLPYAVIVTDAAGNPAPTSTVLNLKVTSQAYQKGYWVFDTTAGLWTPHYTVNPASADPDVDSTNWGCSNEDIDNNGVLQAPPDNDYNNNGKLDPGNVATVPSSVTLNSTGSAGFVITYPKSYGKWVEVNLEAKAVVGGTESTNTVTFVLPVLGDDVKTQSTAPPSTGAVDPNNNELASPYGYGTACSDNF